MVDETGTYGLHIFSVCEGEQPDKKSPKKKQETKLVDSGAGFFIEENPKEEGGRDPDKLAKLTSLPAPILKSDQPECEECGKLLADSFMFRYLFATYSF